MTANSGCTRFALLFGLLFLIGSGRARAADTTETYDVGATDFELYLGFDGVGRGEYEKTISGETVVGFGFIDRFSGYLTVAGESNEHFGQGSGAVSFGVFGTPVDTDHIDLDLFLDVGFGPDEFGITPALEINFDLAPDLAVWGVYLRVDEVFTGRDESTHDDPATLDVNESKPRFAFAPQTGLTAGTYWTMVPGHQLLLEYGMGILHHPAEGERTLDIGGVALGYNVKVVDAIELISQVALDIPQGDEPFSVGFMIGLIVTMPSAKS